VTRPDARAAAERAARASHGRLIGLLASRTRDIAAAEDALAEAFARALESWPRTGIPANPEAWLLTVARRVDGGVARHRLVQALAEPELVRRIDERAEALAGSDPRLELMFVCAHPAIDPAARTPLMLTLVQGLTAERVAAAYLEPPATLSQRLVRAKTRVKAAGIGFALPDRAEWPERLGAVLEAVYAIAALSGGGDELLGEGVHLAGLLARELPREPEVRGLHALLLLLGARRPAAAGPDGCYVPLDEQNPDRWDHGAIDRGEAELKAAASAGHPGRFQLEAAIHSAHCWRRTGADTPWPQILALHERLSALAPTIGSEVARASAVGEVQGPQAALAILDALEAPPGLLAHAAARAHWLARAGHVLEARAAYAQATLIARDPPVRAWLEARRTGLPNGPR
jgi:RNA polymerase sigma-70 factor, ECF subfamily